MAAPTSIAIDMYNTSIVQNTFQMHDELKNLFSRLFLVLDAEELTARLGDLLALPLLPWDDDDIRGSRWPEPFDFVQWPKDCNLGMHPLRHSWSSHIGSLLKLATDARLHVRNRALCRERPAQPQRIN